MNTDQANEKPLEEHAEGHPSTTTPASEPPPAHHAPATMGFRQKLVVALLLTVIVVPPSLGFYSYFSGVPLHLLAATKREEEEEKQISEASAAASIAVVSGQAHTVDVPDEVATALGIRRAQNDAVAIARTPVTTRPLVLPGSTALDPTHLARVRARFAPARVVELAQIQGPDLRRAGGRTQFRELRQGDTVSKGEVLGVFYSVDVGTKKNDLLDALVQLELDQKILDEAQKHTEAVPQVFMLNATRAVQGDRNAINRALNNLKLWDIPQDEIDALHTEAKKISADKDAWFKTPEGRWVRGDKQAPTGGIDLNKDNENPWGRVTLRAPFDGVIVERNVHVDEMVVDNTVNLFQIADVNRLLVIANCPEDDMPTLEALQGDHRRWTVQTVGASSSTGLSGTIDEIGYLIDPNQHTAVIKGYVDNPGKKIRAGQYVTATVDIPPPHGVVEIPTDALVEDGKQSLVFVQPDASKHQFTMRRVQVVSRFERSVFVRDTPVPKDQQLTALEAEEGLLPIEPLRSGERVLLSGAIELKAALLDLESRPVTAPTPGKIEHADKG